MSAALLPKLAAAKNGLEDAHIALCGAVTAHAEAKRTLELAEAFKLREGVEGRNEAQRTARLRLELVAEHNALAEAEDTLTEARFAFELARLEWDLIRYELKAMTPHPLSVAA